MDESDKQSDLEIKGLSLIDMSFEDDCLFNSSFTSPLHHPSPENQQHTSVKFLEPFEVLETSCNSPEVREEEPQTLESVETGKTRSGKYNLRKSLAWDNAFFTSEGVLDSEELSSIIAGTEKREKNVLPVIQEDIHRSTDSLSRLDTDTLTLKSLETDLFEDIRASIQKSSLVSKVANSNNQKRLGETESQTMHSSKNVNLASRDKMKPKIASRKPIVATLGPGKAKKQASVHPQSSKSLVTNGELISYPFKPKARGRINPIPTPMESTQRASISANHAKLEKDNPKNASGKRAQMSKTPSSNSSNFVPRPTLPSRSSLRSSAATKTELTTSCSSFGSSGSTSSDSIDKISLNSMKRKNNSGISNASSSGSTVKSIPRTAAKGKSQSGSLHLTSYFRSVSKHSSSISPASSISEWSSESLTSTSTANQRPNNTRASVDSSSSKSVSADNDAFQLLDFHHDSNDQSSVRNDAKFPALQRACVKGPSVKTGSILCPSSKPSGLRLPSPKIGFFDGVRSEGRTPSGSMQYHPGVPGVLPNIRAGITSPSQGSNKSKLGKVQSARTALPVRNIKPDSQQTAMTRKPRSPLPLQESLIAAIKVSSASKNVKSPLVSPGFRSRMSPKTIGESVQDSSLAEKKSSSTVLKQKVSPKSNNRAHEPHFLNERLNGSFNLSPPSDAENINPSQQVGEDAQLGKRLLNNDLSSLHNSIEQQKVSENEVDAMTRQVGAMEINVGMEKKVVSPFPEGVLKPVENN